METIKTALCIVGGGSAGIGAAIAASKNETPFILVEKFYQLGGTSTMAFVSNWPISPAHPINKDFYNNIPDASKLCRKANQNKLLIVDNNVTDKEKFWNKTLTNNNHNTRYSIGFDDIGFNQALKKMIPDYQNTIKLNTSLIDIEKADNERIKSIIVINNENSQKYAIEAETFIDCTGNLVLGRKLQEYLDIPSFKIFLGDKDFIIDSKQDCNKKTPLNLNAISLCYTVKNLNKVKEEPYTKVSKTQITELKKNDIYLINPLNLLNGDLLFDDNYQMNYQLAYDKCVVKIRQHFNDLKTKNLFFSGYEIDTIAPFLGIRETFRIEAEHILSKQDCLQEITKLNSPTTFIALSDHRFDTHGGSAVPEKEQVKGIYGIPYGCLVVKSMRNFMVAGRCAGFSHIAASSCRLERTMFWLGLAAATAVKISKAGDIAEVNPSDVATALNMNKIIESYL